MIDLLSPTFRLCTRRLQLCGGSYYRQATSSEMHRGSNSNTSGFRFSDAREIEERELLNSENWWVSYGAETIIAF